MLAEGGGGGGGLEVVVFPVEVDGRHDDEREEGEPAQDRGGPGQRTRRRPRPTVLHQHRPHRPPQLQHEETLYLSRGQVGGGQVTGLRHQHHLVLISLQPPHVNPGAGAGMVGGDCPDGVEAGSGGEADDGPAVIVAAVTSWSERRTAGCRLAAITSSVAADYFLLMFSPAHTASPVSTVTHQSQLSGHVEHPPTNLRPHQRPPAHAVQVPPGDPELTHRDVGLSDGDEVGDV